MLRDPSEVISTAAQGWQQDDAGTASRGQDLDHAVADAD
jgi:hypothetical protein